MSSFCTCRGPASLGPAGTGCAYRGHCPEAHSPAGSVSKDLVCVTLRTTTAGTTASRAFFHASLATCGRTRQSTRATPPPQSKLAPTAAVISRGQECWRRRVDYDIILAPTHLLRCLGSAVEL